MELSRQEYWSGLPLPSQGDLPDPGIEPTSPALQADSLRLSHLGSLSYRLTSLNLSGLVKMRVFWFAAFSLFLLLEWTFPESRAVSVWLVLTALVFPRGSDTQQALQSTGIGFISGSRNPR